MIRKKSRLAVEYGRKPVGVSIHNMLHNKPYRDYDVKCDRSSFLGSPFYLKGDESKRDAVCDAYEKWFHTEVVTGKERPAYKELLRIQDIYRKWGTLRIFCWCAPKRCHTETIKKWLEANK